MAINTISSSGNAPPVPAAPQGGNPVPAAPAPAVETAPAPQQQPTIQQVQQAVAAVKHYVEPMTSNSLQFEVDESSGRTIVRITDAKTGDVIRQIPSKEMLAIASSLDQMKGLLLKQKA
jgi:flagellar protein FlaG